MKRKGEGSKQFDVVIVGGGGSGLAAAAEAARLGASVVVLEKNEELGGTTAISVGSIMASRTALQRAAGISDSPERHERELAKLIAHLGIDDNPVLRRLLTQNVGETVDFLASIGVDFFGPLEQPPFETKRFHIGLPGGRVYVERLRRFCKKFGVEMLLNHRVCALIKSDDRVTGVRVTGPDEIESIIIARRGVILASGDFSADAKLRSELLPPGLEKVPPINPASTGDGQTMATSIGAKLALRPDSCAFSVGFIRVLAIV
jgi:succinate dehydrogenase/fumarate reductase flavoprotein subunit